MEWELCGIQYLRAATKRFQANLVWKFRQIQCRIVLFYLQLVFLLYSRSSFKRLWWQIWNATGSFACSKAKWSITESWRKWLTTRCEVWGAPMALNTRCALAPCGVCTLCVWSVPLLADVLQIAADVNHWLLAARCVRWGNPPASVARGACAHGVCARWLWESIEKIFTWVSSLLHNLWLWPNCFRFYPCWLSEPCERCVLLYWQAAYEQLQERFTAEYKTLLQTAVNDGVTVKNDRSGSSIPVRVNHSLSSQKYDLNSIRCGEWLKYDNCDVAPFT